MAVKVVCRIAGVSSFIHFDRIQWAAASYLLDSSLVDVPASNRVHYSRCIAIIDL